MNSDEIVRVHWTVPDIANELGIKASTVRFWIKEFDVPVDEAVNIKKPVRAPERAALHEIHRLRHIELYTIEGTKRQLDLARKAKKKLAK